MSGRGAYYKNLYGGRGGSRGGGGRRGGYQDRNSYERPNSGCNGSHGPNVGRRGDSGDLAYLLSTLEGKGYKAYNDILGCWTFTRPSFKLYAEKIQSDPFAPPSLFRVTMDQQAAGYPAFATSSRIQQIATGDYLTRMFYSLVREGGFDRPLSGGGEGWHGKKGGSINIERPCQHVLERTSCLVKRESIELRFTIALPARGRSIEGHICMKILTQNLPQIIEEAIPYASQDEDAFKKHIECVEDQEFLRAQLPTANLAAFVRDGAILPRVSGADDCPMDKNNVTLFKSPESMSVEFDLPHAGKVTGMGIPRGVTLIVGGGFHGKSTLLNAIQVGVYNHVPGDGREFVCTDPTAFTIRAEDGRSIEKVDIRPFINNLPFGRDTSKFSTQDASGSTSQSANIIEALETRTKCLLIDEDTSATNFMIRDSRMQKLVATEKEPITPFISKVRSLYEDFGVSTILVIGGSGDYFQVADHVIMMDCYSARDVTNQALAIAREHADSNPQPRIPFEMPTPRIPIAESFDASRGDRERVKVMGRTQFGFQVQFGREDIDLSYIEQLGEYSQTRAIADAILYARNNYMDGKRSLLEVLQKVEEDFDSKGLDVLSPTLLLGCYSRPRLLEIAAAINRFRALEMR
ncbi:unnamed protein product [Porites evermanni]|uniref:Uncharacterized protein n=1 Tax=Porites evermanni TaxID=104178 RepID=A0ABN8MJQ0_9CNID|nr:unnamed protein product [Porites evermanni]